MLAVNRRFRFAPSHKLARGRCSQRSSPSSVVPATRNRLRAAAGTEKDADGIGAVAPDNRFERIVQPSIPTAIQFGCTGPSTTLE